MNPVLALVTDDNPVNQLIAQEMLEELGCQVILAAHGFEAVEKLKSHEFDIVFMDCMMPQLDGFAATRLIRESAQFKDLPIIALTAYAMSSDRDRCLQAGMSDYLAKPILLNHLEMMLQKWVPRLRNKELPFKKTEPRDILQDTKMQETFLHDCERLLKELQGVHQKREADELMSLVHQLKSTCTYFGFGSISVKCRFVEYALQTGTLNSSVDEKVEDVIVELDNLIYEMKAKLVS
ncbi:MAG: response regulator [Pseudobdellovibrionaceae bacterium]|jgi:CheY-like chemotaxis protein/HPt (histidine-containing phosphotransfer) domain-containing protein